MIMFAIFSRMRNRPYSAIMTFSATFWSLSDSETKYKKNGHQILNYKEKELGQRPEHEIKFPTPDLSHSFLIKQSVRISLESCLNSLNKSLAAYLDISEEYSQDLTSLAAIFKMKQDNLPTIFSNQDLYNAMVQLKLKLKEESSKLSDMSLLLDYNSKLVETCIETAFLVGCHEVAQLASENFSKLDMLIKERNQNIEVLRHELRVAEAEHVQISGEDSKSVDKDKESTLAQDDMENLAKQLKQPQPQIQQQDIKISKYSQDDEEKLDENKFKFEDNSDDEIKISVKDDHQDDTNTSDDHHTSVEDEEDIEKNMNDEMLQDKTPDFDDKNVYEDDVTKFK